jgi:hypothetical protein
MIPKRSKVIRSRNIDQDKNIINSKFSPSVVATTSTSTQPSSTSVAIATEARKRKSRLTFGIRQRSMPVQIETTIIRVLPKHLRKRIKSADGEAKKKRYITSSFEHFF